MSNATNEIIDYIISYKLYILNKWNESLVRELRSIESLDDDNLKLQKKKECLVYWRDEIVPLIEKIQELECERSEMTKEEFYKNVTKNSRCGLSIEDIKSIADDVLAL